MFSVCLMPYSDGIFNKLQSYLDGIILLNFVSSAAIHMCSQIPIYVCLILNAPKRDAFPSNKQVRPSSTFSEYLCRFERWLHSATA